jgi:hypothetical protein
MSNFIPVSFCFKGSRDYVHGTDVFNKIIQLNKDFFIEAEVINIDMTVRSIARTNMNMFELQSFNNNSSTPINAYFSINANGNKIDLLLVENGDEIDCRYEYNEEEIEHTSVVDIEEKTITLTNFSKYTLIEKIVAVNKKLLNSLFPNHGGKWYFTKIKLRGLNLNTPVSATIKLVFKKNLDFKLTDTIIYVEGEQVGNIYFSLV